MSQAVLPEAKAPPTKETSDIPTLPSLKGHLRLPKAQDKDKVTNILKGYYANVTLKNSEKLSRLDSQCLYVSIIGDGNGIPEQAPILSIRVKTDVSSLGMNGIAGSVSAKPGDICLSIRSQCGWKQSKQENLLINFDLKVDCIGKSHRAPTFLLEFELAERRNSERFVLSRTEILVRAVTKIPKNAIITDLLLPEEFSFNERVQFIELPEHRPFPIIEIPFGEKNQQNPIREKLAKTFREEPQDEKLFDDNESDIEATSLIIQRMRFPTPNRNLNCSMNQIAPPSHSHLGDLAEIATLKRTAFDLESHTKKRIKSV